jgi:hypothetical protein
MKNLVCFICHDLSDALKYAGWTNTLENFHRYFLFVGNQMYETSWMKDTDKFYHIKNLDQLPDWKNIANRFFFFFSNVNYINLLISYEVGTTDLRVLSQIVNEMDRTLQPVHIYNIFGISKEYLVFHGDTIEEQKVIIKSEMTQDEKTIETIDAAQGKEVSLETFLDMTIDNILIGKIVINNKQKLGNLINVANIITSYSGKAKDLETVILSKEEFEDKTIRESYKGKIALVLTSDKSPLKAETTRINKIYCSDGFLADINLI